MARELGETERAVRGGSRTSSQRSSSVEQGGFERTPTPDPVPDPELEPEAEPEPEPSHSNNSDGLDSDLDLEEQDGSSNGNGGETEDGDAGESSFNRIKRPYVRACDRPGQCRGFYIARVVQNTDKVGDPEEAPSYVGMDEDTNQDFKIKLGDFVLVLSPPKTLRVSVRNYSGQEGSLPRRMLQDCYSPWSIPANIQLDDEGGIPLPLRFTKNSFSVTEGDGTAFEKGEAVMVMRRSQNPQVREVVDFERKPGSILKKRLRKRFAVPWGLKVDRDAFESRYKLRSSKNPRRSKSIIGKKASSKSAAVEKTAKAGRRATVASKTAASTEESDEDYDP